MNKDGCMEVGDTTPHTSELLVELLQPLVGIVFEKTQHKTKAKYTFQEQSREVRPSIIPWPLEFSTELFMKSKGKGR